MTDTERNRMDAICKVAKVKDIGDLSDGFHTFNSLYYQRMILFATLVKTYKERAWKSLRHEDGELCFGGGWFIVGIDTPEGNYTYHYETKYFDLFDCDILDYGKHWDGHTEKDVARLLSLTSAKPRWIPCSERLPEEGEEELSDKDTIYRQDAKDAVDIVLDTIDHVPKWVYDTLLNSLDKLPSACNETNKQELIRTMNAGIIATNTEDVYSCGMRNGIRWCRALLEDDPPKFEDASQYAEPKQKKGRWIEKDDCWDGIYYECSVCKDSFTLIDGNPPDNNYNFCPNCGCDMRGTEND